MTVTVGALISEARTKSDHVNSNFVTDAEIIGFLNEANSTLYDDVVLADESFFVTSAALTLSGDTAALPTDCYKLVGIDLASNGRTKTLRRTNFNMRNEATPGLTSSNPKYYVVANSVKFVPAPSGGPMTLWYIPTVTKFATIADVVPEPLAQWTRYMTEHAVVQILLKEESSATANIALRDSIRADINKIVVNRDFNEGQQVVDVYRINSSAYDYDW
jgi:hypothetical protein